MRTRDRQQTCIAHRQPAGLRAAGIACLGAALAIGTGCGEPAPPPPSPSESLARARALEQAGEPVESFAALRAALVRDPDHAPARMRRARHYYRGRSFHLAEIDLERARALGHDDPQLDELLLRVKLNRDKHAEVLRDTAGSDDALALALRGHALLALGRAREAVDAYIRARAAPDFALEAEIGLMRAAAALGDPWLEAFHLARAAGIDPGDHRVLGARAAVALARLDLEAAAAGFHAAQRLDLLNPDYALGRVRTALLAERYTEAGRHLQRVHPWTLEEPRGRFLLALTALGQDDRAEAERLLQPVLRQSGHPPSAYLLGVILAAQGKHEQALDLLTLVTGRLPAFAPARAMIAAIEAGAVNGTASASAVAALVPRERLVLMDVPPRPREPPTPPAGPRHAYRYVQLGFMDAALALLESAYGTQASLDPPDAAAQEPPTETRAPADAATLQARGEAELRAGRDERGLALLEQALARGLDTPALRFQRACALARLGRRTAALGELQAALEANPAFAADVRDGRPRPDAQGTDRRAAAGIESPVRVPAAR